MALRTPLNLIFFTITCSLIFITPNNAASDSKSFYSSAIGCQNSSSPTEANDLQSDDYTNNVASLLSDLALKSSASTPIQGFYNATIGKGSNKVFGSYVCRGDLDSQVCHDCVSSLAQTLSMDHNKVYNYECFALGGIQHWDRCMVQYSNHSTTYNKTYQAISPGSIGSQVSNPQEYNQTLSTTIKELIREAAFGNWSRPNFGTRVAKVTGTDEKIYTLVQCTPEISGKDCSNCLEGLYSYVPRCCNVTQGGVIVRDGYCLLEYNNQPFFGAASRGFMPSFLHVLLIVSLSIFFLYM